MNKINVSVSEMMQLRKQGLSNADIAAVLDISKASVFRYIGAQGKRMDSMETSKPLPKYTELQPKLEEKKEVSKTEKKPMDKLRVLSISEMVASTSGEYECIIEYDKKSITMFGNEFKFGEIPELCTFIIGIADRVSRRGNEVENHD